MKTYDVIIVGAGLVGSSLACMLADQGWRIAIIETQDIIQTQQKQDDRSIVLSYASYQILNALNLWSALAEQAYPIQKIHVSSVGHFGATRFDAKQMKIPTFGYVVPAFLLTQALQQALIKLTELKKIDLISPAAIKTIAANGAVIEIMQQNEIKNFATALLVGADGTQSKVRQLLGIETKIDDYQQTAIISQVELIQDHQQVAYERLTSSGPLAMLPREKYHCGLVWSVPTADVQHMMSYTDKEFLAQLQQRFGYRLGKLKAVKQRSCYPLRLIQAQEQIRSGAVLLGNAAHTLHPLAGQGFNLGLRDAAALAETLIQAKENNQPLGKFSVLQAYEEWRQSDQQNIIRFTDRTIHLLSQQFLSSMSGVGLLAMDLLPFLKRRLTQNMLGYTNKAPKLTCGVPL